jgi:hypothetical protein
MIDTAGTTRHHGHDGGRCEPWPWMIGTSFPAVEARHHLPGVDRHGRHDSAPRARPRPLRAVALDDRHQLPAVDRHGRHDSAPRAPASRLSIIGTTFPASMIGNRTAAVATRGPG